MLQLGKSKTVGWGALISVCVCGGGGGGGKWNFTVFNILYNVLRFKS